MLKRNIILLVNMLLCATLFCACGKDKEDQYIVPENEETMTGGDVSGMPVGGDMHKINVGWEEAYKEVVRCMESYLADPYISRQEPYWVDSNLYIGYIGIHDFDDDNVPELIIGDDVSVGIFTYYNGMVKKIADLYEPESWGCINGVHYKNNTVILTNNGSDGSCYVCFTYDDGEGLARGGEYVIGIYDEYNPDVAIINEHVTTGEEFRKRFDLIELLDNSSIPRSRIIKDDGITTALELNIFEGDDEYIMTENLNFNVIEW